MHQGLGPYFARSFLARGAELAAIVGSSRASVETARGELRASFDVDVPGYESVAGMLEAHGDTLDALVIASPVATHEAALEAALAQGRVAVLCEKPFVEADAGAPERARALCERFVAAGQRLVIHAQWPETLDAYEALHGPVRGATAPRSFYMELAPGSLGARAIVDSLPHPLSLLQAVDPGPDARLEGLELERLDEGGARHALRFAWVSPRARIACEVQLGHMAAPPRPAGYGFDGRFAARAIEDPGYRMFFCEAPAQWSALGPKAPSERRVAVPDPLDARVARFLDALDLPQDPSEAFLPAQRMRMLCAVLDAYPAP